MHPSTQNNVWPVFKDIHAKTEVFHITSSYGLFRRMTGVGGRPEVILEGANDPQGPWIPYEFPYKPGTTDRMLPTLGM